MTDMSTTTILPGSTVPHAYVPHTGNVRWRTCTLCGRGANAAVHKATS